MVDAADDWSQSSRDERIADASATDHSIISGSLPDRSDRGRYGAEPGGRPAPTIQQSGHNNLDRHADINNLDRHADITTWTTANNPDRHADITTCANNLDRHANNLDSHCCARSEFHLRVRASILEPSAGGDGAGCERAAGDLRHQACLLAVTLFRPSV